MATKSHLSKKAIGTATPTHFSRVRTTVETAYHRNNVHRVRSRAEAYELAKAAPGTIISDLPVYRPEAIGLPKDAKVLLFNDGAITGRQAHARRIIDKENEEGYARTLREAVFASRERILYHATALVGLDARFTVKAHLLVPEGYENTLYSWMLNFEPYGEAHEEMYNASRLFEEGDILLYSAPDTFAEGHESGLALFDRKHNAAALLGLRYFGEHKKATLTMGWTIGDRHGFTACHGGLKRFEKRNEPFVMGVFGLSGSGKSTLTHADHDGRYETTVLHDDAFVIDKRDLSTVSLEPAYFDKVEDYPPASPDNRFLLTMQNVGATLDEDDRVIPVTEDIRNGNGRAVKSHLWTPDRAYAFSEPLNAIFWIMKDDTLPPLLRVNDATLASTFGATLATKRTTAEEGADPDALAYVPYANPFRLHPLKHDFEQFESLFDAHGVQGYILNTGAFQNQDIPPKVTLSSIEAIVEDKAAFEPFLGTRIERLVVEGYTPPATQSYRQALKKRLEGRLAFLESLEGENRLPERARTCLQDLLEQLRGESS